MMSNEIQVLIANFIAESCAPDEAAGPIETAIMQARTPEEIELLARALILRKRSAPGGFELRAAPQIKRIAEILGA